MKKFVSAFWPPGIEGSGLACHKQQNSVTSIDNVGAGANASSSMIGSKGLVAIV